MAQSPEFQKYLTPSGYSPEPIVNRLAGFEGPSGFETLARVAKAGKDVYDIYRTKKISDIQESIKQDIAPLIEEAYLGSPTTQQERKVEAAGLQYTLDTLPRVPGPETGQELETTISGVQTKLQGSLDYLKKAASQNRISSDELEARTKSIVKKYLAANPGLRREILSAASNTLQDEGIMDVLKIDDKLIKSQQDAFEAQQKELRQEFKERNIPLLPFQTQDGSIDTRSAQRMLDLVREEEFAYKQADTALKSGEIADKVTVRNLIASGQHTKVANGYVKNAWNITSKIVNSGANYNDTVTNLELELDRLRGDLETSFSTVSNDPTIKQTVTDTISRIDNIKKVAKDSKSLENLKTYMANRGVIDGIIDKEEIRSSVGNLERLDLLSKLSNSPYLAKLIASGNTGTVTKMIKDLVDMEKGVRLNSNYLSKNGNAPSSAEVAYDVASEAINSGTADATTMFNTNTSDRVKAINDIQDVDQRFIQSESLVKQFADPKSVTALQSLSVESKVEAVNLVAENSRALVYSLKRLTDREGVSFSFTPEGKLSLGGVTKQENADIVDRINTNLAAYANLKGTSTKAASQEFFTSVYENVFTATDVPSMDAELKEKVDIIMPILSKIESGNRMYGKDGKLITSPKGAQGKYQIMPATGRRPGFGIPPLDYSKTGPALEKEMERFTRDYLTAALRELNGDPRKAMAAYNAGIPAVQNAIAKAAKAGKPNEWVANLPEETRNYLVKANLPSDQAPAELPMLVKSLRDSQLSIQKANPSVYEQLFKGSSVEMAKDIAMDIAEKHGIAPTWQEVHQILEQQGQVTPRSRTQVLPMTDGKNITNLKPTDQGTATEKEPFFKISKVPLSKDTIAYQEALRNIFKGGTDEPVEVKPSEPTKDKDSSKIIIPFAKEFEALRASLKGKDFEQMSERARQDFRDKSEVIYKKLSAALEKEGFDPKATIASFWSE